LENEKNENMKSENVKKTQPTSKRDNNHQLLNFCVEHRNGFKP